MVREPSGRPSRAGQSREVAPVYKRRLRDAALARMADARWGTEIGRLFLDDKINAGQANAGERWAKLAAQYHAAISTPMGLRSAALERGSLAAPPDPDSDAGRKIVERDRNVVGEFHEAHKALLEAGKLAESLVRSVCERGQAVAAFELEHLVRGLNALMAMSSTKNSRMRRNGR